MCNGLSVDGVGEGVVEGHTPYFRRIYDRLLVFETGDFDEEMLGGLYRRTTQQLPSEANVFFSGSQAGYATNTFFSLGVGGGEQVPMNDEAFEGDKAAGYASSARIGRNDPVTVKIQFRKEDGR